MRGERIEAVKNGLQVLVSKLRQDPFALESVWISIITFDREVNVVVPLTDLETLQLPEIVPPESGPTNTGAALNLLLERVRKDLVKSSPDRKGDWKPLLFLMTDGAPSDKEVYRSAIPPVKALQFGSIVCCAAGERADNEHLKELTDHVVHLDTADSTTLMSFFKWVSDSIGVGNQSVGATEGLVLPPPPQEVHLVI